MHWWLFFLKFGPEEKKTNKKKQKIIQSRTIIWKPKKEKTNLSARDTHTHKTKSNNKNNKMDSNAIQGDKKCQQKQEVSWIYIGVYSIIFFSQVNHVSLSVCLCL